MHKNYKIYILIVSLFISFSIVAQSVDIRYDTITIVDIKKIDKNELAVFPSAKMFFIRSEFYDGANFPFNCLKCKSSLQKENALYYLNFEPIINKKSVKRLISTLRRKKYRYVLDELQETSHTDRVDRELFEYFECVKNKESGEFMFIEQKAIVSYFMLNCEIEKGVSDAILCKDMISPNQIPIILSVQKLLF